MNIEITKIKKIRLTELEALDPIDVVLENIEEGKGRIIITCYGKTWGSYWGAMGDTIEEFFCNCNDEYLHQNLAGGYGLVTDGKELIKTIKTELLKQRRGNLFLEPCLTAEETRSLWDEAKTMCSEDIEMGHWNDWCTRAFGVSWGEVSFSFPQKRSSDYLYLCRIINVVKTSLKDIRGVEDATK